MKTFKINAGNALLLVLVFALAGCGGKPQAPKKVEKVNLPPPAPVVLEKKAVEKYRYKGDTFRDPFLTLTDKKLAPWIRVKDEIKTPNFGSMKLKGIMSDSSSKSGGKLALLATPLGGYVLKDRKLYDNKNRLIPGIKGEILENRVRLTDEENFTFDFKMTENKLDGGN